MAPLSKQPLEQQAAVGNDTLTPEMSSTKIERILREATEKVPYCDRSNHMGSKMTSSLFGMHKVVQILDDYNFYYS